MSLVNPRYGKTPGMLQTCDKSGEAHRAARLISPVQSRRSLEQIIAIQLLAKHDTAKFTMLKRIQSTSAPRAVLLIRLLVGLVFISEGIQKFLFPAEVGAGRFAKIGLPSPEFLGPFVGTFEIVCGSLVLIGFFTRFAVIPLLTIMAVAIYTTKIPTLLKDGFWKMAHDGRADFSMTMCALFLLIVGAGVWSLDARLRRSKDGAPEKRNSPK